MRSEQLQNDDEADRVPNDQEPSLIELLEGSNEYVGHQIPLSLTFRCHEAVVGQNEEYGRIEILYHENRQGFVKVAAHRICRPVEIAHPVEDRFLENVRDGHDAEEDV